MNLDQSPLNWFDLLVVIVLLVGVRQGRKNGMSGEMMPMLQWITIVFAGAFLYRPLGDMLADSSPMGHLFCYITMYIVVAMFVKIAFILLKKGMGGKAISSDLFGRGEFYLGMFAGAIRFAAILVAGLALLNAPYYSTQDIANKKAYDLDMYGSQFFPGLSEAQVDVFKNSFLGSTIKKQAEVILIVSTKAEHKEVQRRKDDLP